MLTFESNNFLCLSFNVTLVAFLNKKVVLESFFDIVIHFDLSLTNENENDVIIANSIITHKFKYLIQLIDWLGIKNITLFEIFLFK